MPNLKFILARAATGGAASFLLGGRAFAQDPPTGVIPTGAEATDITSITDVQEVVTRIVGWAQVFFYIIATLFIIFAAFKYLTSGGEDEKVKEAKNMLIYSIVAIAIAAVSGGVVLVVRNFLDIK